MDFSIPTRKVEDDDLMLETTKKRKLMSPRKKQGEQEEIAPRTGGRKLNLAGAVGGKDTGIEEQHPGKQANIAPQNTSGNANNVTTVTNTTDEPTTMQTAEWYFMKDGRHTGPNTADDLKELYELQGTGVTSETYVWAKGVLGDWMPIQGVTELYEFLEDSEEYKESEARRKEERKEANKQNKLKKKQEKQQRQAKQTEWFELKVNTSVYVHNLPDGTTGEMLAEYFKKVGVIKIDPITKKPKAKVYKDNDGLVTFMKPESVQLAVDLLDGAVFDETTKHTVNVKPAEFKKKGTVFKPREDLQEYQQQMRRVKKQQTEKLGWNESDSDPNARTVVVRNCFSPEDFRTELNLAARLKKTMQTASEKHGPVDSVKVYPEHPDGVIMIRYKSFISAQECLEKFSTFDRKQVSVSMWDHIEKFAREEDVSDKGTGFGTAAGKFDDSSDDDDGFTY
eukprot:TRINITY_DN4799_c2_g1_i1.p1 TRINITY_DN4799_c2_g1~~TRINITY_DN4799_c2_g1_i1.p1  ORF type:complete len:451 (+),score=121.96 TRINITY_DN4799_c2_g1_i1:62-1414(+)